MQEAGQSIFLGFCSRYHFLTLRLPIYYANIKSMLETLFFCGQFSTTMYVYIDMYGWCSVPEIGIICNVCFTRSRLFRCNNEM